MKSHVNYLSLIKRKGFVFGIILMLICAMGYCIFVTNESYAAQAKSAEKSVASIAKDQSAEVTLNNPATVSNDEITVSGYVYYDPGPSEAEERLYNEQNINFADQPKGNYNLCANADIYLDEVTTPIAITKEDGSFEFNIDRYSKGALHAKWSSGEEPVNEEYVSQYYYFNYEDTAQDYKIDILVNPTEALHDTIQHYAIVNSVDDGSSAGTISSVAYKQEGFAEAAEYESGTYTRNEDVSVPLLWDVQKRSSKKLASNSQYILTSPMGSKGAKVSLKGDKLVVSFSITQQDSLGQNEVEIKYWQELTPTANSDYKAVFDGWYHFRIDPNNNNSVIYEKCHDGDFLYSYYDNYTMAEANNVKSENPSATSITDGGAIGLVARFVVDDGKSYNKRKITVKVDDTSQEHGYGYIYGTNGNSSTNINDKYYLTNFEFNLAAYTTAALSYTYGQIYGEENSNSLAFGQFLESAIYAPSLYELGWIKHTTNGQPSKISQNGLDLSSELFSFVPKAMPGYAFAGWTIMGSTGQISTRDGEFLVYEEEITCIAKFVEASIISGVIYDKWGNTVSNARVSFADANGYNVFHSESDAVGHYSIYGTLSGGTLTVAHNEYYTESYELSDEHVKQGVFNVGSSTPDTDGALTKPENAVYLCGQTFYEVHGGPPPVTPVLGYSNLSTNLEAAATGGNKYTALVRCTVVFTDEDSNKIFSYYQYDNVTQEVAQNASLYNGGSYFYKIPVIKGHKGTITISCDGFQRLIAKVDSNITNVEADTEIDLATKKPTVTLGTNGKFIEWTPQDLSKYGKTVLATSLGLNVYVATENADQGTLKVATNNDAVVEYTAGMNFKYGDQFLIDYKTGALTINRNGEKLLECVPVPKDSQQDFFFGWVAYSSYGERIELMSSGTLVDNLSIYAQFKKGTNLNALADSSSQGHKSYQITFDSNELPFVDIEGPIVWSDDEVSFRQYNGTKYTVSGDSISLEYDESWENPDIGDVYKESTIVKALPADDFTFSHWLINGKEVKDGDKGSINYEEGFDIKAVYSNREDPGPWPPWPPYPPGPWPPVPPVPPDPPVPPEPVPPVPPEPVPPVPVPIVDNGGQTAAQTSDATPLAVLGLVAALAGGCIFVSRKRSFWLSSF